MTLAAQPVGPESVPAAPTEPNAPSGPSGPTGPSGPSGPRFVVDPVGWPRLVEVLDALTPVESRAVTAVYFEGRTFRETADLLALDVRAVSRAIAAVRRPVADHVIVGVEG